MPRVAVRRLLLFFIRQQWSLLRLSLPRVDSRVFPVRLLRFRALFAWFSLLALLGRLVWVPVPSVATVAASSAGSAQRLDLVLRTAIKFCFSFLDARVAYECVCVCGRARARKKTQDWN